MELDRILDKIRALINKAESYEASKDQSLAHEAQACRERADVMMQKYAVEEWQTAQKAPVAVVPTRIKIDLGDEDNPFLTELATLVNIVSKFCKCSSIWMEHSGRKSLGIQEYVWVYGYESDLRYFEMLFTTIHLHMLGAIFPKPDPNKTLGENAYELHNAGLNWFDIAKAYGWYQVPPNPGEPRDMYVSRETGERASWARSIGRIKAAYRAEVSSRAEEFLRISPAGSETYRRNAAMGYLSRIKQRLDGIAGQRGTGAEVVLADKSQNIAAALADDFPHARQTANKKASFNATAYRKGVAHANTASLNPQAPAASTKAIE
jgi:hypothetical protein